MLSGSLRSGGDHVRRARPSAQWKSRTDQKRSTDETVRDGSRDDRDEFVVDLAY